MQRNSENRKLRFRRLGVHQLYEVSCEGGYKAQTQLVASNRDVVARKMAFVERALGIYCSYLDHVGSGSPRCLDLSLHLSYHALGLSAFSEKLAIC